MSTLAVKRRTYAEDRRHIVKFVIQNFQEQGGKVLFPSITSEDTLYDALDVVSLTQALKTEEYLDLGKLTHIGGEGGSEISSEFHHVSGQPIHNVLSLQNAPSMDLELDLDDHELQQFGFLLFCIYGLQEDDNDVALSSALRRQLELSAAHAADMMKIAFRIKEKVLHYQEQEDSPLGVDLLLLLLQETRPNDFRKFREFVNWRDSIARLLVAVQKDHIQQKSSEEVERAYLIASLKGAVRRLCFQEEEDFEEREYKAAIHQVKLATNEKIAFHLQFRICLWEVLLNSLFESYEEDVYIDEAPSIQSIFEKKLATMLQISVPLHESCFTWVHFKQLSSSAFPGIIPVLKPLFTDLMSHYSHIDDHQLTKQIEAEDQYIIEVLRICSETLIAILMDYHDRLQNPQLMPGIIELFLVFSRNSHPAATRPCGQGVLKLPIPSLEQCIESSCTKAFHQLQKRSIVETNSSIRLKLLADHTRELHEDELLKFTGALAQYCPSAAAIAAKAFHTCYGQELIPVLFELTSIPKEVVSMIKAADLLEGALMREISQEEKIYNSVARWNVMEAIAELLGTWVDAQLRKIRDWLERLMEKESWQPQSDLNPIAASALELKRLLEESVALVLSMDLYFPDNLVEKFVTGIAGFFQSYAEKVVLDIGGDKGMQLLIPPVPPPARYKRDVADAAAMKEIRQDEKTPLKRHSRFKSLLSNPEITRIVPLIEESENYPWFNNLKLSTLIVRINSLFFLHESVPELKEMIKGSFGFESGTPRLKNDPFLLASQATKKSMDIFGQFLGIKLVFWDGRLQWFEQLYRHHVSSSRIDFIIHDIHKSLVDISSLALEQIRNQIATSIFEACVHGLIRVLVDGGPYRLFKIGEQGNDRELIEQDAKKLKDLFYDNNDGLSLKIIEEKSKPLLEILLKMSLPTDELIKFAEDAKGYRNSDFDVFCKILGHRADHPASKWLKKTVKWPKKVKTKF